MQFDIPKRANPNIHSYKNEDIRLAHNFAAQLQGEMGTLVKGIMLFGSAAKKSQSPSSDIDVLVLMDDVTVKITKEMTEAYRIVVQKLINQINSRLHITTLRFTSFWQYIRNGDPVGINILRDGVALYDTGFFEPMQVLLQKGQIRPSDESIWTYFTRAPYTLQSSKWHLLQAMIDLYWAAIDSSHAALMKVGEVPPTPAHVPDLLRQALVKKNLLEAKYVKTMQDLYRIQKAINHHEIQVIKGIEYDKYLKQTEDFIKRMKKIVDSKTDNS